MTFYEYYDYYLVNECCDFLLIGLHFEKWPDRFSISQEVNYMITVRSWPEADDHRSFKCNSIQISLYI